MMRTVVVVALSLTFSGALQAQPISLGNRPLDPAFVSGELQSQRSVEHAALADVEHSGKAIWDPSSQAWYAAVNGTIVQLTEEGRMVVVSDNVQGHDIDVRMVARVAVSREPDDRIVLHQAGPHRGPGTLLLEGPNYFNPRFSPDGKQVLVHESRAAGSRLWLITVNTGDARVLTEGVAGAWHPDGSRILFARVMHDSRRIIGSKLYEIQVASGTARELVTPFEIAGVEPAVSPDGLIIVFVDPLNNKLISIPYPKTGKEVDHGL
jgi:hypothetical protein